MIRPSVDWRQLANLVQGGCASDGVIPGQPPGHTKCVVAIDPGVEEDNRNDREWQTPEGCNDNIEGITTCIPLVI